MPLQVSGFTQSNYPLALSAIPDALDRRSSTLRHNQGGQLRTAYQQPSSSSDQSCYRGKINTSARLQITLGISLCRMSDK